MPPLVSVLVPAYNAEETLAGTLDSIIGQSYPALEILVIDDGSSDRTAAIATEYGRTDPRVVLLQQENGGVASARNRGLARATGKFIAPIDADDVWHRDKIRLQVEAIEAAGDDVALVYTWYRRIDGEDRIIERSASPVIEGWVLHRHLEWNFVSNGSAPLMRASALRGIRYDEQLRKDGNGGCEDYLLQLELALHYRFICVPAFLTGYRRRGGEMSSDVARMIRSHLQMYRQLQPRLPPEARKVAHRRIAELQIEMVRNRAKRLRIGEAARAFGEAVRLAPTAAARHAWRQAKIALGLVFPGKPERTPHSVIGQRFDELDPFAADPQWRTRRSNRWLRKLERLDRQYGRELCGPGSTKKD